LKIVVDTSVIIAVITNEKHKPALVKMTKDADLIAPASLHWEVGNAFSAMLKRKRMELESAILAIQEYNKIPIQFYDVSLETAIEYAKIHDMYAYDAYFLVCAKNAKCSILTLDSSLIMRAKDIGIGTLEV